MKRLFFKNLCKRFKFVKSLLCNSLFVKRLFGERLCQKLLKEYTNSQMTKLSVVLSIRMNQNEEYTIGSENDVLPAMVNEFITSLFSSYSFTFDA